MTLFILLLWVHRGGPEAKKIAVYVSDNILASILCCVALTAFKCFVPLLPTTIIYIVAEYLLPWWYALFVCLFTNALIFTVSYVQEHSKSVLYEKCDINTYNAFLYSLVLHCVRIIPANTAGRILGKSGASFIPCFVGSLLGKLPVVILTLSLTLHK